MGVIKYIPLKHATGDSDPAAKQKLNSEFTAISKSVLSIQPELNKLSAAIPGPGFPGSTGLANQLAYIDGAGAVIGVPTSTVYGVTGIGYRGNLSVGNFGVTGLSVFNGNVQIGTASNSRAINAPQSLEFHIDTDQTTTNSQFLWGKDSDVVGGAATLMTLQENGDLSVSVGNLSIAGTTTLTGVVGIGVAVNSQQALKIQNNSLSGTSQYGIAQNSTFTSAATVAGYGVYTSAATAAASYTMTNAYGLFIDDMTKGSGSTITTQTGLYIESQTKGGTNWAIQTKSGRVTIGDTTEASAGNGAVIVSGGIYAAKILYTDSFFISTLTAKNSFIINSSGDNFGFISNPSANKWSLAYGTTTGTLGTAALTWDTSGVVEFAGEVKLASANTVNASVLSTVTNKIKMVVNGTTYYLLASTSNA